MSNPRETHGFQAEVRQLMQLMIHSLYSHREIFLRELISNASDANDKLRFLALGAPELLADDPELAIWIDFDAKAGTAEFFGRLTGDQQRDAQLIGQFGVGFYSAFIVSDRVEVLSRRAGEPPAAGIRWESSANGEFTIE